jgi:hypothetical protein
MPRSFPQRLVRPLTAFALDGGALRKRSRALARDHLKAIRLLPCAVCASRRSTEAAHVRSSNLRYGKQQAGLGTKPDDAWTVPLCADHHREQHQIGEASFWEKHRVDPFVLALALWRASGDDAAMEQIVRSAYDPVK